MNLFGWLHNKFIGQSGERVARRYLKKQGLTIIATNWRSPNSELDVVAISKKKKQLHIVEVKSRTSNNWEAVGESITKQKIAALRRGAVEFKHSHSSVSDYMIVFDVVVVFFLENNKPKVEYVQNINFN